MEKQNYGKTTDWQHKIAVLGGGEISVARFYFKDCFELKVTFSFTVDDILGLQ